jgi:naphthoate synthase
VPIEEEAMVSELFDAKAWRPVEGFELQDLTYHRAVEHGTVRIAFHRPEVRNAFRPSTVDELYRERALATRRRVGLLLRR